MKFFSEKTTTEVKETRVGGHTVVRTTKTTTHTAPFGIPVGKPVHDGHFRSHQVASCRVFAETRCEGGSGGCSVPPLFGIRFSRQPLVVVQGGQAVFMPGLDMIEPFSAICQHGGVSMSESDL